MNAIAEAGLEEVCLDYVGDLGWTVAHGPDLAPDGKSPERSSYADVVLEGRLRAAVQRLNPTLPPLAVDDVVKAVGRAESQVVISENWRVYQLLTLGVPVDYRDASGNIKSVRAALIDWDDPANNDFLAVNQFTITQDGKTRRPDILHFVNGLPLGLEELKVPGSKNATLKGAHNQIKTYMHDIPALFACNAVCVISTGTAARMGTMTGSWEHYAPWKTIDGTDIAPNSMPQVEVLLRGVFDKTRFLDLVRNFIVFSQEDDGLVKRVAKYHQFWAVNAAIERTIEASSTGDGRAGVVWHTKGSGKSLEMLFYSGKIMRNAAMNNPTLVLLTDRNDLDDQLFGEVFGVAKTLPDTPVQATSRDNLRTLLTRNSGGIVFTTLQKFGLSKADRDAGRSFPALSQRKNVVVIADEATGPSTTSSTGWPRTSVTPCRTRRSSGSPARLSRRATRTPGRSSATTSTSTTSPKPSRTERPSRSSTKPGSSRWTCRKTPSLRSTRPWTRPPRALPTRTRLGRRPGGAASKPSSAPRSASRRSLPTS